jgi:tetratricopeptide (TPR) repeat protein
LFLPAGYFLSRRAAHAHANKPDTCQILFSTQPTPVNIAFRLTWLFLLTATLGLPGKTINPVNDAAYDRATAAFDRQDWAAAVEGYTEALKHARYMLAYINRASAYVGLGKYDEAIADFDTAILMVNDAPFSDIHFRYVFFNRAQAYMGKKDFEKAIGDFSYIIGHSERSVPPFMLRGSCELQLGRLKEARHDLQVALKLSPHHLDANLLMLRVCMREGDAAATRRQLDNVRDLVDKSPSVEFCNALAQIMATSADEKIRDGRQAVRYATQACEMSMWMQAQPVDTLAAACAEIGDFANAIKWEQDYLGRDLPTETEKQAARARLDLFQRSLPYHEAN